MFQFLHFIVDALALLAGGLGVIALLFCVAYWCFEYTLRTLKIQWLIVRAILMLKDGRKVMPLAKQIERLEKTEADLEAKLQDYQQREWDEELFVDCCNFFRDALEKSLKEVQGLDATLEIKQAVSWLDYAEEKLKKHKYERIGKAGGQKVRELIEAGRKERSC